MRYKNFSLLLGIMVLSAIFFPVEAAASLISVDKDGRIMVKVLSAETSSVLTNESVGGGKLEVTRVANLNIADPGVALSLKEGKVSMNVVSNGTVKELDVTGMSGDLVEIEERPSVQKLTLSIENDTFGIKQGSFVASTGLPVEIDAKNAKVSLTTERGKEYVSIFPTEAVESALRSGIITRVTEENIAIASVEDELAYRIVGEKVFNILNLTEFKLPVTMSVSAQNGKVLGVDSSSPIYKLVRVFVI